MIPPKISFLAILVSCLVFLAACTSKAALEPTATDAMAVATDTMTVAPTATEPPSPLPSQTATPTASSTPTRTPKPTATITPTPTETSVPGPASLSGKIILTNGSSKPFITSLTLTNPESVTPLSQTKTDRGGNYLFKEVQSGKYELWVLITPKTEMIAGCNDILLPDASWRMGIIFDGDKGLTMNNSSLNFALLLAENMKSSGMQATGFYAVLPDLEIKPRTENALDIRMICQ